ncbi:unnamed protein product, partial [Polarella glacialis]
AFRKAIFSSCSGKVVLEVGCGSGILSVFAAQAGASRVVAVEGSPATAARAKEVVHANNLSERISIVTGAVEEVVDEINSLLCGSDGGPPKADVIISEWMGYLLMCEDMFPSVAFARDRWLVPGGQVIPCACELWLAPFSHPDMVEELTAYWQTRPYEVDMTPLARHALDEVIREPVLDHLRSVECIISEASSAWRMDCAKCTADEARERQLDFDFSVIHDAPFH